MVGVSSVEELRWYFGLGFGFPDWGRWITILGRAGEMGLEVGAMASVLQNLLSGFLVPLRCLHASLWRRMYDILRDGI